MRNGPKPAMVMVWRAENRSHTLNGDCVDRIMGLSPGSISRRCRTHISELGADHAALKGACSGQWQRVSALPFWEEARESSFPFARLCQVCDSVLWAFYHADFARSGAVIRYHLGPKWPARANFGGEI